MNQEIANATITTATMARFVTFLIKQAMAGIAMNPFLFLGGAGLGKTEMLIDICKELGVELVRISLPTRLPHQVEGVPYPDLQKNITRMIPIEEIGRQRDAPWVLLFDELPSAPPAVQAAALTILQERRIGATVIPNNVAMIALGNRARDGASVNTLKAPTLNRMGIFHVEPDADKWIEWMRNRDDLSDEVLSWVISIGLPSILMGKNAAPDQPFTTPRSLYNMSRTIRHMGGVDKIDSQDLNAIASAYISPDSAAKFCAWTMDREKYEYIRQALMEGKHPQLKEADAKDNMFWMAAMSYMAMWTAQRIRKVVSEAKGPSIHTKIERMVELPLEIASANKECPEAWRVYVKTLQSLTNPMTWTQSVLSQLGATHKGKGKEGEVMYPNLRRFLAADKKVIEDAGIECMFE